MTNLEDPGIQLLFSWTTFKHDATFTGCQRNKRAKYLVIGLAHATHIYDMFQCLTQQLAPLQSSEVCPLLLLGVQSLQGALQLL